MILIKDNNNKKEFWFGTIYLGYAYMEVDGCYVFMFDDNQNTKGCWSDYSLRWIADKLTELNKEFVEKCDIDLNIN